MNWVRTPEHLDSMLSAPPARKKLAKVTGLALDAYLPNAHAVGYRSNAALRLNMTLSDKLNEFMTAGRRSPVIRKVVVIDT